jgi:hypothetical protein
LDKKTSIISVRVEDTVKITLEKESQKKNLTLNTLIGQILAHHVEWNSFMNEIGFAYVTKAFLRSLLENTSQEEVVRIANGPCKDAIGDAILYMHGDVNLETFVKTVDKWFESSSISHRHRVNDGEHKYVIQHHLSKKLSIYFKELFSAILSGINYRLAKITLNEQSVGFTIEKKIVS